MHSTNSIGHERTPRSRSPLGALALCGLLAACEPVSALPDDESSVETSTSADASSSPDDDPQSTAEFDSGLGSDSDSGSNSGSSSDSGSTGDRSKLLVSPDDVFYILTCDPDEPDATLYIEVYLVETSAMNCVPPSAVEYDDVLLIALTDWDGTAGTYEFGDDPRTSASVALDTLYGTITVEVDSPYEPTWLDVDLAGPSQSFVGGLDFSRCSAALGRPHC